MSGGPELGELPIGVRAAFLEGWFDEATGSMWPGFPIGPEDVVADIGCGDGGPMEFCARRGARLHISDIDPDCVALARGRLEALAPGRVEAVVSDSDPLPFADRLATRTVCMEVIEHVADPDRLLAELFRITRPGGRLLLACPDPRAEAVQRDVAPALYFEPPHHVRVVGAEALVRMTERAGFEVERRDTFGVYQALLWSMFWAAETPLGAPHPLFSRWAETWDALLALPQGPEVQRALNRVLPKSQLLIARRPG